MSQSSLLGRKVFAVGIVLTVFQTAVFSQTPLSTLIDDPNDFLTAGNLTFKNFSYTPIGGSPLHPSAIRVFIDELFADEGLLFEANWPGRAGPIPGDFARILYDVYVAPPTSEFQSTIIGASLVLQR